MSQQPALFRTVPEQDLLGFWGNDTFHADKVAKFLNFDRTDVAKVSGVSLKSVRFDHKMPKEVLERLTEIATICGLVAQFFRGDERKTALWFRTPNPLLGGMPPRDMIRLGRYQKLHRFVVNALLESGLEPTGRVGVDVTITERNDSAQTSAA
jgi:hypothetical protein